MKKLLRISIGAAILYCVGNLVSTAWANQVTTDYGTWDAWPGQSISYQAAIQQPINSDGSSNFRANGNAVIPVKFALSQGIGPFVFESKATGYAYSYLVWQPNAANGPFAFNQLKTLSANYAFTFGDCHAGSLRWDVWVTHDGVEQPISIYYGNPSGVPTPPGQSCIGQYSGSGKNLISNDPSLPPNRFEMRGWGLPGTPMYTTYEDALAATNGGTDTVVYVQLTIDSAFAGDQVVSLTSATVEVGNGAATPYTETFTPQQETPMTPTCATLPASMTMTKLSGAEAGAVNEPQTIQPQDTNGVFRIVDCKYMYNLATSSLSGSGEYKVFATIEGTTFDVAHFYLK
jgi:hypothetical protein